MKNRATKRTWELLEQGSLTTRGGNKTKEGAMEKGGFWKPWTTQQLRRENISETHLFHGQGILSNLKGTIAKSQEYCFIQVPSSWHLCYPPEK